MKSIFTTTRRASAPTIAARLARQFISSGVAAVRNRTKGNDTAKRVKEIVVKARRQRAAAKQRQEQAIKADREYRAEIRQRESDWERNVARDIRRAQEAARGR